MAEDSINRSIGEWLAKAASLKETMGLPSDASEEELVNKALKEILYYDADSGEKLPDEQVDESFISLSDMIRDTRQQIMDSTSPTEFKVMMLKAWLKIAEQFELLVNERIELTK